MEKNERPSHPPVSLLEMVRREWRRKEISNRSLPYLPRDVEPSTPKPIAPDSPTAKPPHKPLR